MMFKFIAVFIAANFSSLIAFLDDVTRFRRFLKSKFTKSNDAHKIMSNITEKRSMQCA